MNKISMYMYLCYISLALSLICLVVAVVLFFYNDIRGVIGYLTGHSARREIKALEGEKEKGKGKGPELLAVEKKEIIQPQETYENTTPLKAAEQNERFVLEREIVIVHTDERI